jgi:hypothetical protein
MSRLIVVLLALSSLALPSAAHAERWVGADPTGDAQSWQYDPADDCPAPAPTTSDHAAGEDITSLTVRHQPRRVVMVVRYAADTSIARRWSWLHVDTPGEPLAVMVDERRDRTRRVRVMAEIAWEPIDDDCGGWAGWTSGSSCRGDLATADERRLEVSVPRSCLHQPAWVKVGVDGFGRDDEVAVRDVWGTDQVPVDPNEITYGPRVRVSPGQKAQKAGPSNRSRVTNSETSLRRSFVISRAGLPSGTTAATAY